MTRLLRQVAWYVIEVPPLTAMQIEIIIVGDAQGRGGQLARIRKSLTGAQLRRKLNMLRPPIRYIFRCCFQSCLFLAD